MTFFEVRSNKAWRSNIEDEWARAWNVNNIGKIELASNEKWKEIRTYIVSNVIKWEETLFHVIKLC